MSTCAACTARYATPTDWHTGQCDHDSSHVLAPLTRADLSVPIDSADRAPIVDVVTLSQLHEEGREAYALIRRTEPWNADDFYASAAIAISQPWGGVTIGPDGPVSPRKGYAVTVRAPLAFPVSYAFGKGYGLGRLPEDVRAPYLGVFRDEESGRIDIDPVAIVATLREAYALSVYCHSTGGAYNFADGLGYWTPTLS